VGYCTHPLPLECAREYPAQWGTSASAFPRGSVGLGRDPGRPEVDPRGRRTDGVALSVRNEGSRSKGRTAQRPPPRRGPDGGKKGRVPCTEGITGRGIRSSAYASSGPLPALQCWEGHLGGFSGYTDRLLGQVGNPT